MTENIYTNQDQAELEAKQRGRLAREAVQGLTERERAELDAMGDELIRTAYRDTRAEHEAAFVQQAEEEYLQVLRAAQVNRSLTPNHRSKIRQEADAAKQQKIAQYLADRDTRELQAETHEEEIYRLAYSLDDSGRAAFVSKLGSRPGRVQQIEAARQNVKGEQVRDLTAEYIAAMRDPAIRGKGWKLRELTEHYKRLGVPVHSIDFS